VIGDAAQEHSLDGSVAVGADDDEVGVVRGGVLGNRVRDWRTDKRLTHLDLIGPCLRDGGEPCLGLADPLALKIIEAGTRRLESGRRRPRIGDDVHQVQPRAVIGRDFAGDAQGLLGILAEVQGDNDVAKIRHIWSPASFGPLAAVTQRECQRAAVPSLRSGDSGNRENPHVNHHSIGRDRGRAVAETGERRPARSETRVHVY
jgi:hypothetical protein